MAKCHFNQATSSVPVGAITDLDNNLLIANQYTDKTNYEIGTTEWLFSGARTMVTRFWSSSTASIIIVPHIPTPITTCPPIPEQLRIERDFCLWLGYLDEVRRITPQDLTEGRLVRVFIGVVDSVKSTGSANGGYTVMIQARDRIKWLMDSEVYYSAIEVNNLFAKTIETSSSSGVPRSLLIHDVARRAVGGPPNKAPENVATQYKSKRNIAFDDEQSEDISDPSLGQVNPYKFYQTKVLTGKTITTDKVEKNPKLRAIVTRIAIGGEYDQSRNPDGDQYPSLSFLLTGQVALDIIKTISFLEVYPTEFFQDNRDGNFYYIPRTNDASGLQDYDRFYRTYFFNVPNKSTIIYTSIKSQLPDVTSTSSVASDKTTLITFSATVATSLDLPDDVDVFLINDKRLAETQNYDFSSYNKIGGLYLKKGVSLSPDQLQTIREQLAASYLNDKKNEYLYYTSIVIVRSNAPTTPTTLPPLPTIPASTVTFTGVVSQYTLSIREDILYINPTRLNEITDDLLPAYQKVKNNLYIKKSVSLTSGQIDSIYAQLEASYIKKNNNEYLFYSSNVIVASPTPTPTPTPTSTPTPTDNLLYKSQSQDLIAFRQEESSIGMKTNFFVSKSSPMSSATPHEDLVMHLSTNPYELRNVDYAPKFYKITDPTIKTAEEAAVVALSAARIWGKETKVAMAVMLGDPSLVPGEVVQIIGSPSVDEGGVNRINVDRATYFQWEKNNDEMIKDYAKFSALSTALNTDGSKTDPPDLKYIKKISDGVYESTFYDGSKVNIKIPVGAVESTVDAEGNKKDWWQDISRNTSSAVDWILGADAQNTTNVPAIELLNTEFLTQHYGKTDSGTTPESKPTGFEELPKTLWRVDAVLHKMNLGNTGYTTEIALTSPF